MEVMKDFSLESLDGLNTFAEVNNDITFDPAITFRGWNPDIVILSVPSGNLFHCIGMNMNLSGFLLTIRRAMSVKTSAASTIYFFSFFSKTLELR
jgi:Na+/H+-dicarboxylate symporter